MFLGLRRSEAWSAARATVLSLALAAAAACDSPTVPKEEPAPTLAVQLWGALLDSAEMSYDGGPSVSCVMAYFAWGVGTGTATWTGATFRWFAGVDRSTPTDTVVMTSQDLVGAWTKGSVNQLAGTDTTAWRFTFPIPFEFEVAFR